MPDKVRDLEASVKRLKSEVNLLTKQMGIVLKTPLNHEGCEGCWNIEYNPEWDETDEPIYAVCNECSESRSVQRNFWWQEE